MGVMHGCWLSKDQTKQEVAHEDSTWYWTCLASWMVLPAEKHDGSLYLLARRL
jgi:hypothetical protein